MPSDSDIDGLFGGPLPKSQGGDVQPDQGAEPPASPLQTRVSGKKVKKTQARPSAARKDQAKTVPESVQARYRKFVTAYLKNPSNQTAAYRQVYPDCKDTTAWTEAGRLIRHPWVKAEIARRLGRVENRADVKIADLVSDLTAIKGFDVRKLYGPVFAADGSLAVDAKGIPRMRPLEPWELDDDTAAALDGLKIKDGKFGRSIEYKAAGKIAAIEQLARYKGMLKDPEKPPIIANIQINF